MVRKRPESVDAYCVFNAVEVLSAIEDVKKFNSPLDLEKRSEVKEAIRELEETIEDLIKCEKEAWVSRHALRYDIDEIRRCLLEDSNIKRAKILLWDIEEKIKDILKDMGRRNLLIRW